MMPTNNHPRPGSGDPTHDNDHQGAEAQAKHPRLLSQIEFAELVNRSPRTIRDWVRSGHLTPHKVGRRSFYLESDVFNIFGDEIIDSNDSHLCVK